jgi:RNA polymerase sigma-70 factor (ECF subfamily)
VGSDKFEDDELIRRISEGDLSAFEKFVERYKTLIYSTCYKLLDDFLQAEDATQDVFWQIYQSAEFFRGESKVSTWVYRIAVNRSLNIIRRNRRFRWIKNLGSAWKEDAGKNIPFSSRGEEPDRIFEEEEAKSLVRDAIDSLPEKQRMAFILHKYESLTSREISEILGVSVRTVEARIHRAKRKLQKELVVRLKKNILEP